jgi:hypothetical protein
MMRSAIRDMVGQCILGHDHAPDSRSPREGRNVPRVLADYKVRIVAIPYVAQVDHERGAGRVDVTYEERTDNIVFCAGKIPVESLPSKNEALAAGMNAATSDTDVYVSDIVDTGSRDVSLYVKEAWFCLREQGEHFASAPSSRTQSHKWRVREVRPGEDPKKKASEKRSKSKGRAPRGAAVETAA